MEYNYNRDARWPIAERCQAALSTLSEKNNNETFEKFRERQLEYNSHLYPSGSDDQLRKEWLDFREYKGKFCGLCGLGEVIDVNKIEPNVIVFSRQWRGSVQDHSDLELWLRKSKRHRFSTTSTFTCEIYSFGTIAESLPGSAEYIRGERGRSKRVSHLQGVYEVIFDNIRNPSSVDFLRIEGWGTDAARFDLMKIR